MEKSVYEDHSRGRGNPPVVSLPSQNTSLKEMEEMSFFCGCRIL